MEWELEKNEQAQKLLAEGQRVYKWDLAKHEEMGAPLNFAETQVALPPPPSCLDFLYIYCFFEPPTFLKILCF